MIQSLQHADKSIEQPHAENQNESVGLEASNILENDFLSLHPTFCVAQHSHSLHETAAVAIKF